MQVILVHCSKEYLWVQTVKSGVSTLDTVYIPIFLNESVFLVCFLIIPTRHAQCAGWQCYWLLFRVEAKEI